MPNLDGNCKGTAILPKFPTLPLGWNMRVFHHGAIHSLDLELPVLQQAMWSAFPLTFSCLQPFTHFGLLVSVSATRACGPWGQDHGILVLLSLPWQPLAPYFVTVNGGDAQKPSPPLDVTYESPNILLGLLSFSLLKLHAAVLTAHIRREIL
jgi:hypothetical protein